eukprot:g2693.t1
MINNIRATKVTSPKNEWLGWNGIQKCKYREIYYPTTEKEICRIVKSTSNIRVLGTGKSSFPLFQTDTLIDLSNYRNIVYFNRALSEITVQSGIQLYQILDFLEKRQLTLKGLPDIRDITIGGAIATGTHGTGKNIQALGCYINACRLIKANGDVEIIRKGDRRMHLVSPNLGYGGVYKKLVAKPRNTTLELAEWCIPIHQFHATFAEIQENLRKCQMLVHIPMDIRVVYPDKGYLSNAYGNKDPFVTIGCISRDPETADSYVAFRLVESICKKYQGRPHWGKRHTMSPQELEKVYPKWIDGGSLRLQPGQPIPFSSQHGQDEWIAENLFYNVPNLRFVEFGARDGVTDSNTFHFERNPDYSWKGLCVEPLQLEFNRLVGNRPGCDNIFGAITGKDESSGKREFLIVDGKLGWNGFLDTMPDGRLAQLLLMQLRGEVTLRTVNTETYHLEKLVERSPNFSKNHIDYLSIDTEGSELEIIKGINFDALTIDVIQVEINENVNEIKTFLLNSGYRVQAEMVGTDIVFARNDFVPTTAKKETNSDV